MSKEINITELEASVLGLIWMKGPCTPYLVRKEFQKSPTPFWSGSAGAIYPLIKRLIQQKLIMEESPTNDGRGGKLYILSTEGEQILKDWLKQPIVPMVIGTPPDLLRNRVTFLGFLSPQERKQFLAQVKQELEVQLQNVIRYSEDFDKSHYFDYLSMLGTVLAARARLDWIMKISKIVEKQKIESSTNNSFDEQL